MTRNEEWIRHYRNNRRHGDEFWLSTGRRYCCPACGYPTLLERDNYEVCELCYWQDIPGLNETLDADDGPPNHISLREAQQNFNRHLVMYEPDYDPRTWRDGPTIAHAKRVLVQLFDLLCEDLPASAILGLSRGVHDAEEILRFELTEQRQWLCGSIKGSSTGLYPKGV